MFKRLFPTKAMSTEQPITPEAPLKDVSHDHIKAKILERIAEKHPNIDLSSLGPLISIPHKDDTLLEKKKDPDEEIKKMMEYIKSRR